MRLIWVSGVHEIGQQEVSEIAREENILIIDYISNERTTMATSRSIENGVLDRDFDPPFLSMLDLLARAW